MRVKLIELYTASLCYVAAISISHTKIPKQTSISLKRLFDLQGFHDRRYSVLAIGAFIAMLGQFIPYYYISTISSTPHRPVSISNTARYICASYKP
jgi:hypothetical protein